MVEIYRTHDYPIELNVNTLKSLKLNDFNFHRCLLNNIDMTEADLSGSDFRSAEMMDSVFRNTIFCNTNLIMVEAKRSRFDGCVFHEARLLHSDFSNSSFKNADFAGAIVNNVNFAYCDLRGAVLNCDGLQTCCFEYAIYDEYTVWRKGYDVLQSGAAKRTGSNVLVEETSSV